MKMHKTEFKIMTTLGARIMTGWVVGEWGVYKHLVERRNQSRSYGTHKEPRYSITYLPTGLKLCDFYNLRPAQAFIKRMAQAQFPADWKNPPFDKNLRKVREIYFSTLRDFPQYTSLSGHPHFYDA